MCGMLGLFARTALHDLAPKRWMGSVDVLENGTLDDLCPSIESIYGITPFLAKAILKNHELALHLAYYSQNDRPESLLEACEALYDELTAWSIESEEFATINAHDGPALAVAGAQATAFYNATLIYHLRTIQQCNRAHLRGEQQKVLEAMNRAEDLKTWHQRNTYWAAPITWPAFIASCEAVKEDREAWACWWNRVQTYGLANYAKQWRMVRQVWTEQDIADDGTDWRKLLFDMGVRIIPV